MYIKCGIFCPVPYQEMLNMPSIQHFLLLFGHIIEPSPPYVDLALFHFPGSIFLLFIWLDQIQVENQVDIFKDYFIKV